MVFIAPGIPGKPGSPGSPGLPGSVFTFVTNSVDALLVTEPETFVATNSYNPELVTCALTIVRKLVVAPVNKNVLVARS